MNVPAFIRKYGPQAIVKIRGGGRSATCCNIGPAREVLEPSGLVLCYVSTACPVRDVGHGQGRRRGRGRVGVTCSSGDQYSYGLKEDR